MESDGGLRVVTAGELGLSGPVAERVAGFELGAALDSGRVPVGPLADAAARLPDEVDVVVFVAPAPTPTTPTSDPGSDARLIARLVERLDTTSAQVALDRVPAVDAVKRIEDGYVVEAVDRSTLNLLRPPQVVDRGALAEALAALDRAALVAPAVAVADAGGRVEIDDDPDS